MFPVTGIMLMRWWWWNTMNVLNGMSSWRRRKYDVVGTMRMKRMMRIMWMIHDIFVPWWYDLKRGNIGIIKITIDSAMQWKQQYKPYANDWSSGDDDDTWFHDNSCDNMSIIWRDAIVPGTRTIWIWAVIFWQPIHRQSMATARIIWF